MKIEPQILRDGAAQIALQAAAIKILLGFAAAVLVCVTLAVIQDVRRGLSAAAGWLTMALVLAVLAAALAIHSVVPAASCERRFAGLASYYSNGESGARTANGERFDDRSATAAHPCLPFGTRLRVRYAGRSVVVRINDRGPFVRGRVIDLARAPAAAIGLVGPGVARIEAEVVD